MMEPLPDRIERFRLDPCEIDPERSHALDAIVARVRHRLANGQPRPVVYPARPAPPVRTRPEEPEPASKLNYQGDSIVGRVRACICNGERNVHRIAELSGCQDLSVIYREIKRHEGGATKVEHTNTTAAKIREGLRAGLRTAEALMQYAKCENRNHVTRVTREWLQKGEQS